ncbi:MAG: amidohydrolase family protein [SAR202 cluster bacterium]|nr:amidohydrolase family protein [SAR202 cluster bacterium]
MFDLVILGGNIVDGTGKKAYRADVGIAGERIEAIGDLGQAETHRVIVAHGLTVSPGFIDSHAHSDGMLLLDPQHANGIRQGITTELLGQDGLSYAPLSPANYRMYSRYLAGLLGLPPADLDMHNVTAFRANYHKKCAVNTAYCVAHGAIRVETLGFRDVPLVGDALKKAKRLVHESIEQGAVAFSTGMSYYPNCWSTTAELVELCKEAHAAGALYVTHLRDVNTDRGFGGGGVPEAIEIGRRSGIRVHFSHFRTLPEEAGQIAPKIAPIDKAKKSGLDCTLELYPYPIGSSFLPMVLPPKEQEGGPDAILKRLRDPARKQAIAKLIDGYEARSIAEFVLTHTPNTPDAEGLSLPDFAKKRGKSMGEAVRQLLVDNDLQVGFRGAPPASVATWRQLGRDQMELLSRPDYMVGSDAIPVGNLCHPRAYGCFPRFLGRLRKQMPGIMSLETMVQRMTDNPARRFGLTKRGRVQKGYFADLAVFDADRIIDNATFDDPKQFPTGIPYVLVNGQVAVDNERCTGVLAGQAVP